MTIRPTNYSDTAAYNDGTYAQYYDTTTRFVPELYSKKVLKNFYKNTFYQDIFNTDLIL